MLTKLQSPGTIPGGMSADARGTVSFVNDFDFQGVDRFYVIRPNSARQPRGWVGHRREHKWFYAVQGEILISLVQPDSWEHPSGSLPVNRVVLSSANPQVLHVPPGYATGNCALQEDSILLVFSSGRFEAAKDDDYRFAPDTWVIVK